MNGTMVAEIEHLRRTAERLQRAGLIVNAHDFSRPTRRAYFALQCQLANEPEPEEPPRPPIGFAYPNVRDADGERPLPSFSAWVANGAANRVNRPGRLGCKPPSYADESSLNRVALP
jgi:hypothetical protein